MDIGGNGRICSKFIRKGLGVSDLLFGDDLRN